MGFWMVGRRSATGYKGVTMRAPGRYEAVLYLGKRRVSYGYHPTAEAAARRYDLAAAEHRRPYAETNAGLGLLPKIPFA